MATNYSAAAKTTIMEAKLGLVPGGKLEILTAADAVLVVHTLATPAGSVTDDVWTLGFVAAGVAATGTGVAAKAQIKNAASAVVISGLTVGATSSGANVELQNTNIAADQVVSYTSATITHAADA
jgi:hypothetical protein